MKKCISYNMNFLKTVLFFLFSFSSLFAQNFLDTFEDGTTNGWEMGASPSASNISSGGPNGVDDNYMQLAPDGSGDSGKLIVLNQTQWRGNFTSLGVTAISFYVNNFNASNNIDLRIALKINGGSTSDVNSWCATTNTVHLNPVVGWQIVSIPIQLADLSDLGDGTVTVSQILANVGQVRILDATNLPAHRGDPSTDLLGLDYITDGNLLPPNTAPLLNWTGETGFVSDGVNPDQGTPSDSYTFRVEYSDADGDAPSAGYPRVYIIKGAETLFGGPLTMNQINGDPFNTGRIYTVNVNSLVSGNDYSYRFEAEDINGAVATGTPASSLNGPTVNASNTLPVLAWTGQIGAENDGVDPDTANTTDSFTFSVKFIDADDNAPANGYPRLILLKNGTSVTGSPFAMIQTNSNPFITGRIYAVNVNGLAQGNDYSYRFEAEDINGGAATGEATASTNGPVVVTPNSIPVLSWTGETGYVNDGVNPDQAGSTEQFIFRVKYADSDGGSPAVGYPRLRLLKGGTDIVGSPFVMTEANSEPFTNGRIYSVSVNSLISGNNYSYFFEGEDIPGLSAIGDPTNSSSGPIVEVDASQLAFSEINVSLPNLYGGDMAWGDYDSDGDLDLALVAFEDGSPALNQIYRNDGSNSFFLIYSVTGSVGSTVWGDYDADGDLDLLLSGKLFQNNNNEFIQIGGSVWESDKDVLFVDYDNDGDLDLYRATNINSNGGLFKNDAGSFTIDAVASGAITEGALGAWGDYDNDGDKDLVVIGGGGSFDSYLYRNDNGTFVDWEFDFDATSYGEGFGYPNNGFRWADVDWGDYDNDGDLDFVICGQAREEDAGTTGRVLIMYRNDGPHPINTGEWLFTQTEEERYWPNRMYEGIYQGSIKFADFSNDGLRDFLVAGSAENWDDIHTNLYINVGTDTFQLNIETQNSLVNKGAGSRIAVGDYDNDGDLDFMQYGYAEGLVYTTSLFQNNISEFFVDNPPLTPTNLQHEFIDGTLILSWDAPTDDFTGSAGLTYNVRVGTQPDSQDVVVTHAFPDGKLKIPFKGNAESARIFKLAGLPVESEFFWSVQAIDAGLKSSPFAQEESFNTLTPTLSIGIIPDTLIAGEPAEITWNTNNIQNIKIEYINNNADQFVIENSYPADSGRYEWMVPELPALGYKLRISNIEDEDLFSESNEFAIISRYIKIYEPNGGEIYNGGDSASFSWFAPYESDFRLEYSTNNGVAWTLIIDIEQTFGSSTEQWQIPYVPSTQCLVRVTDLNHPTVIDVSDAVFTINQLPSVSISQIPIILIAGQIFQIQWTAINVDIIKIEYVDGLGNPNVIEESYSAVLGQYLWTVPQIVGTGFAMRITSVLDTNVLDESNNFSISLDQSGPQITEVDLDPEVIEYGQTSLDSVSVKIYDDSEIVDASVTLYYKESGAKNYSSRPMTLSPGVEEIKEYEAEIIINQLNQKGIQLYVTAEDIHGNIGESAVYSIAVNMPAVSNPEPPRSGFDLEDYSLFSIPLVLANQSVENFLNINTDLGSTYNPQLFRLYSYQNGSTNGFIEYNGSSGFPDLVPGKGFFIITGKDIAMSSGAGTTVDASSDYQINGLQAGWNLIGNPFNFPVSVDSVYASSQVSNFVLWEYNGVSGWNNVETGSLVPWKGYALFLEATQNNLSFYIPPVPAEGVGKSTFTVSNNTSEEWMIQIEALNGNSKSSFNFAGQSNRASDGHDIYDLNSPPVIGKKVALSFENSSETQQVTDVRKSNKIGHIWNFSCFTTSSGKTLTLDFKGIESIDNTVEIFLINKDNGLSYDLRKQSSIIFIAKGESAKQFQLIAGTKEYLASLDLTDKLFPEKFELYNNFPNPFNPQTQIIFSLAQSAEINLVVYDVLGQQVEVLEKGFLEAGSYNVVWNAEGKSSGVYFIRLLAGNNIKTIRALLLK